MPKELVLKENNENKEDSRLTPLMRKRLGEGVFIVITAMALFLLLSLVSYNKLDPGWFAPATLLETANHAVFNSTGWVGAYAADIFLCFLGVLAYCLPMIAVYLAWIQFYTKPYEDAENAQNDDFIRYVSPPHNGVRLLGAFLLIFGAAGLASFEFPVSLDIFPYTTGGVIGDSFSRGLNSAFNHQGTVILLLAMCFAGITLLTGLSWVATSEVVGMHTLELLERGWFKLARFAVWIYWRFKMFMKASFHALKNMMRWMQEKMRQRRESRQERLKNIEQNREYMKQVASNSVPPDVKQSGYEQSFVAEKSMINSVISEQAYENPARDKSPRIDERAVAELSATINENVRTSQVRMNVNTESPVETKFEPKFSAAHSSPVSAEPSPIVSHTSLLKKVAPNSLPPLSLLEPAEKSQGKGYTGEQLEGMAREVEQRLLDFGIEAQVVAVNPGPVITRFELQLAAGVKVSRIVGLAKDLARSLSVISVRVVDVIPGKPVIGLELPNQYREMVRISQVFETEQFQQARSPISMALGVDISGHPVIVDLAKMPHLLVAGTTGSGKSVGLNAMLLSILFKATPEEVRLILVDPKMLEFSIYDRIPHLLTPVVTDMKEAAGALRWSVAEMERRYKLMSALGLRNLAAYNTLIKESQEKGELIRDPLWKPTQDMQAVSPYLEPLPYIVVVIDELADMMMIVGKKVEQLIARIAQKARAAGIHLILATQRPSVDVLTGLIKSNIPTRIAFQVSSKIDSRTILDQQGADQLLGHGDMLYLTPGSGAPVRIHGAFVDDKEVHRVADAWRERGDPQYVDIILREEGEGCSEAGREDSGEEADPLYDEAVSFVTQTRKASISSVQRRLKVGYNRAARLIEEMERTGVISSMESNGVRDVLAPPPPEN